MGPTSITLSLRPKGRSAALVALLSFALSAPAFAGSTGSSDLFMPQGSGGGTANGDYVSADTGGLDTVYRYFIEVPSGLSRLRVQLFDADLGAGGANEDDAQRDRARNAFDTTVTYSLIDPAGAARPIRFTTGSTTLPAGGDNAWLDLYNGDGRDVRDNFGTNAYTNNNGTDNWSAAWIETDGGGGGATGGAVQVTGGELRIQDGVTGTPAIEREADLLGTPGLNFQAAYLTFDYRTSNNLEDADQIRVQISNNGGGAYTTLETFTNDSAGTRTFDVTGFIANNTRVRFQIVGGFDGTEFFFVDNLRLYDGGALSAGHWEVDVDQSSAATGGDDLNAIGIRADDGDATSGGTELNVYYDSHSQYGVNPPTTGSNTRSYVEHPYVTSGCSCAKNDFDYDSNSGTVGSMAFASRTGAFTRSFASAALSVNDTWRRDTISGWTSDVSAADYGIWKMDASVTSYTTPAQNGNYSNIYISNFQAAANPPAANPTANAFRVYLLTDAGTAPVKTYVEQLLTHVSGPNPPAVNQQTVVAVTVRVVNPEAKAVTFSAANLVTANIPGGGATYGGSAVVSQGTFTQPAVGATGNVTWNPGTLAAGATAILSYRVRVTPTAAGQRVAVTATPASGNGTRAQFLDITGNAAQARATYLFGPLCELAVTQGLLTEAVVSSFALHERGGAVVAEWRTASEAGTAGFLLYRWDRGARRWTEVDHGLLAGLLGAAQGGTYSFVDAGASPREPQRYLLVEVEADGGRRVHGPFDRTVDWSDDGAEAPEGGYERLPHSAARSPRVAAASGLSVLSDSAAAATATGSSALGITIRDTGLYYLASADIAPFLGQPVQIVENLIGVGKLDLTRGGQPVAWYPDLDRKRGRGLFFYGEAADSLFTRDAVYRLGNGKGLLMETPAAAPAGAGSPAASFTAVRHAEVDALPATALALDPASDYWFWDFLQSGDPTFGTKSFPLEAPGLATPTAATLRVRFQGGTASGVAGEHHAAVAVNGTPVGETSWQGITAREADFAVPAGVLQESGNQIGITGLLDAGVPFSIFYLDALDLTYPRLFHAAGDQLAFRPAGGTPVAIDGFSAPALRLLDVADPRRPRWIEGAAVLSAGPAGYQLRFAPASGASYLAAGPAAVLAPRALRAWSPAGLRDNQNAADYLIVAPAALAAPAARLAALRQAQGLDARVVDLQQIEDEFGAGVPDPAALRTFLLYANKSWSHPPRYVALAGAGSLDYRDLLGFGGNLLPPLLTAQPDGLFPADNLFAEPVNGALPAFALGRIPARTAAELDAYVDKVATYEAASAGGADWVRNVLLLADATDRGVDFKAEAGRLAALFPEPWSVDSIDLDTLSLSDARSHLLHALADGASLVDYVGHGGLDRLAAGGLLASGDVPGLTNAPRLPVLTAMTCAVNRFAVPGVPSLGSLLTLRANGGAAAVWAPSGLSINAEAGLLSERFYRLATSPTAGDPPRLGDLILNAFTEFRALGGSSGMVDIYALLGDPALRLAQPSSPPPTGGATSGE